MRTIDEIRESIKDLIEKAEKSVDENLPNEFEKQVSTKKNNKNLLPDTVLSQIKEEVTEFQNAFEDHEVKNEIAQQYFFYGNGKRSLYLFMVILTGTLWYPLEWGFFYQSFKRGEASMPFYDLPFESLLSTQVAEIRKKYHIKFLP